MRYDATPGRAASAVPRLSVDGERDWTVVMVAHPHCPCTATSLKALRQVVAVHGEEMATTVVFANEGKVEKSVNLELAQAIPGAKIVWMSAKDAEEKYHSYTSGQVFVYASTGELAFSGGITPGRNADQPRFALQLFDGIFAGNPERRKYKVFGCKLRGEE
jgi:hypothetical protein